jgi:WD40 repeat protein
VYKEHHAVLAPLSPFTAQHSAQSVTVSVPRPARCALAHNLAAIASCGDECLYVYHTHGTLLRKISITRRVYSVKFLHTRPWLVAGEENGMVSIIDATTGTLLYHNRVHTYVIRDIFVSEDDSRVYTASWDFTASQFSIDVALLSRIAAAQSKPVRMLSQEASVFEGHNDKVNAVIEFMSGGVRVCATASEDNTVMVWASETGEVVRTLTKHCASVQTLAVHADRNMFSSGGDDRIVSVGHMQSGSDSINQMRWFCAHSRVCC